ncbi:MAG TPA: MCE family protein [Gemmatimonadetes bacterium]|jgi:phospholipid/cholesterol/gamma-HCH transport system substrate-binding protein|nr:MCE family protein [Gemmatimonadota bacterium]HIB09917.1 MCE family protein [Gemmatimonadota bacterium]HIN78773.1 MCE family protein [Gemmatimonadota bacterium]
MSDSEKNVGTGRDTPTDAELLSAVPPRATGRQARLGLFVIMGLLSFVVVLYWMTDPATFRGRYLLVTTMEDAGGVRGGDPVSMKGIIIGRVHDFELIGGERVTITTEIEGKWKIPVGSRARLGASGLFGGRTLVIDPSDATEYYGGNDTVQSADAQVVDLLDSAGELSSQAGDVMTQIESLLSAETIGAVQGSARELEVLLTEFGDGVREQREALGSLTESLNRSAKGLEDATTGPELARAVARADSAMAMLTNTGDHLNTAAESLRLVLERIERGEGTLGRLVQDDALYLSLTSAAESVTAFLADLQENPSKYINLSIF